ncbi:MAG TPA: universal stress protein [Gemmatimonadaceae bacterium]|nr:universal stress protein [Gemmatimonadaceae bacterium]
MFHRILVGLDGSEGARRALEQALRLASLSGATVHALSIEERLPAYAATVGEVEDTERFESQYFRRVLHEAHRLADARQVELTSEVAAGHAAQVIVRKAKETHCDLIVLGHTGHSRLHDALLGSTADRVVEHAGCAVLVVR